jgi:hypothetical protein
MTYLNSVAAFHVDGKEFWLKDFSLCEEIWPSRTGIDDAKPAVSFPLTW